MAKLLEFKNLRRVLLAWLIAAAAFAVLSAFIRPKELVALYVMPWPREVTHTRGSFKLRTSTIILADESDAELRRLAEYLVEILRPATGFKLPVHGHKGGAQSDDSILLRREPSESGPESYRLSVTPARVTLAATEPRGVLYGIQTLRQMLPVEIESQQLVTNREWKMPLVEISDAPRFPWRGVLLDCSRHFMSKQFVMRIIDQLAAQKLNVLHWHLTDDQGWRIEIKKYPKLTEVGAWRMQDGARYGGFYTQEDIREVVAYATSRYVTVIPEIELPGHCNAALAAYPELSCSGGPFKIEPRWGVYEDVYCAGNEQTERFLKDVLSEVAALFPAPYIHIGGDEVPKARWKACPKCQARMKRENLTSEEQLQASFVRGIATFLEEQKQRRIIGWDEILSDATPPGAIIQAWHGPEKAATAASAGHDVIASPTTHCYFDQSITVTDLKAVLRYNPVPPGLDRHEQNRILGGEACVWTEYIPQDKVEPMLFPRVVAFSEVLWTGSSQRDWRFFRYRLKALNQRLQLQGVNVGAALKDGGK